LVVSRLEVFASVPWGDGPGAIPLALRDHPPFGEVSPGQLRKVRVPVRIRLDARGGVHVLSTPVSGRQAVFIQHLDANGSVAGRTPLDSAGPSGAGNSTIRDYAVDEGGNCYLLEQIRQQNPKQLRNRLAKFSATGTLLWSREGPGTDEEFDVGELKGNFQRLWMDEKSRLFLPAIEHAGTIAEIDRQTGDVSRLHTSAKFSGNGFLSARGRVVYALYFQEQGRRGVGVFDLASESLTTTVGAPELYSWLASPFGVDESSNLYTWQDSAIARIAPDGRIAVMGKLENVCVGGADGTVYSSVLRKEAGASVLQVTSHGRQGLTSHRELTLRGTTGQSTGEWRLIHVDGLQRYYVFGGEEPGQAGTLQVYSDAGVLMETLSPPPDLLPLESTLESPAFWGVDRHGRIYMPVLDSHGLKVIRLTDAGMQS
jgi:hypothetical protein